MMKATALNQQQSSQTKIRLKSTGISEEDAAESSGPSYYKELAAAFRYGDVVYGLDQPRDTALKALKNAGFEREAKTTPSPQKSKTANLKYALIQNDLTNAVWNTDNPRTFQPDRLIAKTLSDANRGINFKDFLSRHSRYNVTQDVMLSNYEEQRKTPTFNPQPLFTNLWKKTSKAGLEYQLLKTKNKIHFVVDNIIDTLDMVASKTGHGTSITSSELRWLYRHKETSAVKNRVRFWSQHGEIPHQEILDPTKWKAYRPQKYYWPSWLTSTRPPRNGAFSSQKHD